MGVKKTKLLSELEEEEERETFHMLDSWTLQGNLQNHSVLIPCREVKGKYSLEARFQ